MRFTKTNNNYARSYVFVNFICYLLSMTGVMASIRLSELAGNDVYVCYVIDKVGRNIFCMWGIEPLRGPGQL